MQVSFAEAFQGDEHRPFQWQGSNGRAALLIHGFPGSPAEMRPVAEHLHQAGWTVKTVLLPGFGAQIDTLAERTHDEWMTAVEAALAALQQSHEHVMVAGNSMGGALSLCLAAHHNIDALMLFAPFWQLEHLLWRALPVINVFLSSFKPFRLFKPDFSDPQFRQSIHDFMPSADLDDPAVRDGIRNFEVPISMFNEIRTLGKRAYECAPQVTVPTLIIQGTQDELVTPAKTQQLIPRMGGDVTYHEVTASHELLIPHAAEWSTIQAHMDRFLQTLSVSSTPA